MTKTKSKPDISHDLVRYVGQQVSRQKKQVVVDEALSQMIKKHKIVSVDIVLAEVKKLDHPLHAMFEWDDTIAAEKFRKMQAYALILSSRFTVQLVQHENSHVKVMKSARVRRLVNAFNGEGFKLRTDALKNDEDRNGIIEKKKSVLRSWCQSVIDIEELKSIRETIENLIET